MNQGARPGFIPCFVATAASALPFWAMLTTTMVTRESLQKEVGKAIPEIGSNARMLDSQDEVD